MRELLLTFLLVMPTREVAARNTGDPQFTVFGSKGAPAPQWSEYLKTEQGGFVIKTGEGVAYAMLFQTHGPERALYTETSFQNPCKNDAPFLVRSVIAAKQKELQIESPAFKCIRNHTTYRVRVRLFADESRKRLVGEHEQRVLFAMPEDQAIALGLTLP